MTPFVNKRDWSKEYTRIVENYLMLVPQKVKNMRLIENVFPDVVTLDKQNGILDSLEASLDSLINVPVSDPNAPKPQNDVFSIDMSLLEDSSAFDRINKKFKSTLHHGHTCSHLKLDKVYEIEISNMKSRFDQYGRAIGNIKELWHGTRVANVLSILHKGLIMPKQNYNLLFGTGIYFSDQSTKSLNYSHGFWDGGAKDNECFMFLSSVSMGKEYVPLHKDNDMPKKGYDSTYAIGGKSGVINNEMVIYNLNQCNLTYLCKFK
jgi:poly [ADP-ribose] polymerase